ncbi:hypothetical protein FXN61_25460 [Lentzea sp. PSKA42]|uniref:Tetratricopeptide repeat-containing protein n=1 Tax=Lentzea indica TaxID=2604800 RepID=A0ABX1FLX8_9PSEU|nr:hypothetical protein [Lentzea indica]NKE59965.1 hypothetical protein [Lentzea indica]
MGTINIHRASPAGDVSDDLSAQSVSRLGMRPIAEWVDPLQLEIHPAVDAGAAALKLPTLPTYIERAHDRHLERVVQRVQQGLSGIAVLIGGSSTGKTRSCWEAVRSLQRPWRLCHPIDPDRPEALGRALNAGIPPCTVIWLNEIQFYLLTADAKMGERIAAGLRDLLRSPSHGPVLVLGTVWPEHWWTMTKLPRHGAVDSHAHARELLMGADIAVADEFDDAAMTLATVAAQADPRLSAALAQGRDRRRKVTQFLAGAPALLQMYRNAPRAVRAIITGAIDLRRFDCGREIPESLLRAIAPSYLDDDCYDAMDEDWFEQSVAIATSPCHGSYSPLIRIRSKPGESGVRERSLRLADYLEQAGRRDREELFPPENFIIALLSMDDGARLHSMAQYVDERGRSFLAAVLYYRALELGSQKSAIVLADLLDLAGDAAGAVDVLAPLVSDRYPEAVNNAVVTLLRHGQIDHAVQICVKELNFGNARPLVRAREALGEEEYDRDFAPAVLTPECPELYRALVGKERLGDGHDVGHAWDLVSQRVRLWLQAFADEAELMRGQAAVLMQAAARARDERRLAKIRNVEDEARRRIDSGEHEMAHSILVCALNALLVDTFRIAQFYEEVDSKVARAIEKYGVVADGAPGVPFCLVDVQGFVAQFRPATH